MKRRDVVKGIILFSIGTGIIYSCTDKYKAIRDLNLKYFTPEDNELDLVESMSQKIVPINLISELANHTALPLIFTMLDDVYSQEDKAAFQTGYQNFDAIVESMETKKFTKMNEVEQYAFLSRLNSREKGIDKSLQAFFDIVKTESIKYLKTSEYYQRKVNYYEMAPGRFDGDILVSELKNANEA